MAKDRDKNSEYDDQIESVDSDEQEEDPEIPDEPVCPRCGWHNTRPSFTKTILDSVFRTFGLHPYRCRTCGNRFRVFCRTPRS